ncbi:protein kinase [Streptomyces sp. N2-109]|uniref:non-specific serine/threonine protein kinase n=1 Tax=Streptomyces gossypii TaxID=2883101 RepID=A0ABT2JS80_9ACTN|nr:serine/threonine-protein kinase [Streptomyces gossypii]MCT2590743.1 protein kinase [Streptomyces gossypii]
MQITPLSPEDPVRLGDFEIQRRIGQGGMGQVFLGESPGGEPAAVKVIRPSVVDSVSRQRFAQEVEVLKTVWGPRIAAFLGADAEAEQPWLATEYVEGPDLGSHVKRHGPLPTLLTAALGAVIAEGLVPVHQQGLLHRDLKPTNILLGPNGPKIIDFGLAVFSESNLSLTASNQVVGTPVCMAPEQAAGEKPLSEAVDVYALGTLLLFAATGRYPYQAANAYMVFRLVTDPKVAPDLSGAPEELVPLVSAMLARTAADRPSLAEVVRGCREVVEGQGMKIAQARRRLTSHTMSLAWQDLSPVPEPLTPTVPCTNPPEATAVTVPQQPSPTEPEPRQAAHAEVPGTGRTQPPATRGAVPEPAPEQPREPSSSGTVLHSAQARRTAEQLRRAYAASASL